jgi:Fe-S cluster assembly protein SufD
MADKDTYLSNLADLETELAEQAPAWLTEIRSSARDRFAELGFPTTHNEHWRFTRLRPLLQHDFTLERTIAEDGISDAAIAEMTFDDSSCHRIAFINGNFASDLSHLADLPEGVRIANLREAFANEPTLVVKDLAQHADTASNPFIALNTAHLVDGTYIEVAPKTVVDKPIHLVFVTSAGDGSPVSHPRNLIVAREEAQLSVIESYVGKDDEVYFTNAVTELVVGRGARVDHYKAQKESLKAYHVANIQARVEQDAHFETRSVLMGGALVRNDINAYLSGENIECTLDGLYIGGGTQHIDNHTLLDHAMPHCNSYESYRGILTGRARGVFNGKIHVHPDAQKTDAKQSNGCMLLSDDAQINTNPQLEIYADDVKCTHGAVVGQIDEDAIFYLRSRGIPKVEAREQLIHAFANEVLERIEVTPLRDRLEADLFEWLSHAREDR